MKLYCVGTGSKGNCYLLESDGQVLLLDAGVPIKDIKKALNFDISRVVGCVVTHNHTDHSKSIKDLRLMGIPVFAPYIGEQKKHSVQYIGFRITSFEVPHDGEPCVGFYITVGDRRFLYATDFEYIPVHFKTQKLTDLIIECNHCDDLLSSDEKKYSHSVLGHASLEVTKGIVEANKTDSLTNVILCHLSEDWSDEKRMVEEVQGVAGNNVLVCAASQNTNYILNTPHI